MYKNVKKTIMNKMRKIISLGSSGDFSPIDDKALAARGESSRHLSFDDTPKWLQELGKREVSPQFLIDYLDKNSKVIIEDTGKIKAMTFPFPVGGTDGFLGKNLTISEKVGSELLKKGLNTAHSWKPRQQKAFGFFKIALENTLNPSLTLLKDAIQDGDIKRQIDAEIKALMDVVLETFFLILNADDMADNGRNEALTRIFCDIPTDVTLGKIETLKLDASPVQSHKDFAKERQDEKRETLGIFTELYGLTVETWMDSLGRLKFMIPNEERLAKIIDAYKQLMESNITCLKVNQGTQALSTISHVYEEVNIIQCFYEIQQAFTETLLEKYKGDIPEIIQDILGNKVVRSMSANYSAVTNNLVNEFNASATLKGELERGDLTNNLLGMVSVKVDAYLARTQKDFLTYVHELTSEDECKFTGFTMPLFKSNPGNTYTYSAQIPVNFFQFLRTIEFQENELFDLHITFKDLVKQQFLNPEEFETLSYKRYVNKLDETFTGEGHAELKKRLNGRYSTYEAKKQATQKLKDQLFAIVDLIFIDMKMKDEANKVLQDLYDQTLDAMQGVKGKVIDLITTYGLKIFDKLASFTDPKTGSVIEFDIETPFQTNVDGFLEIYWLYMISKESRHGSF